MKFQIDTVKKEVIILEGGSILEFIDEIRIRNLQDYTIIAKQGSEFRTPLSPTLPYTNPLSPPYRIGDFPYINTPITCINPARTTTGTSSVYTTGIDPNKQSSLADSCPSGNPKNCFTINLKERWVSDNVCSKGDKEGFFGKPFLEDSMKKEFQH